MEHNTMMLIGLGIWFAFMLFGSVGMLYWACFGKVDNKKYHKEWWE